MFWLLVHSVDRHKNPLDIRQLIVRRYLHYSKYLFALVRTVHLTKKGKKYIPAFLFDAVWMGANFHLLKRMFISAYSSQPALWKAGQEFYNQTSHLFGIFLFLSFQCEIVLNILTMEPKSEQKMNNFTLKRKKRENIEQVRCLVVKFLPSLPLRGLAATYI